MKQILQDLQTGKTRLVEVPVPSLDRQHVLVSTRASLISAGTERMLVEFARAGWIEKARSQPDKVRQVLTKIRTDGLATTMDAVRAKLAEPLPLGYCHAGIVMEVGSDVRDFRPGDRVATNGPHASIVAVSSQLCARIPHEVSFEAAAFTPLAAVALHGIRIAKVALGETVVVYGLGLVGLLTVQLLRASGCRVVGIDHDRGRLALAERFGATTVPGEADVVAKVVSETGGVGADAVLLTLASDSDEPVARAAEMSRKRGRLVLVGVTGLRLRRDLFYKKELSFKVSCSYGPGRYDSEYEDHGRDYPLPYVRWTEQRNFEAVLAQMAAGRLDPLPLVSHDYPFADAPTAYDLVTGSEPSLGIMLTYEQQAADLVEDKPVRIIGQATVAASPAGSCVVGVIGAGGFAQRVLIPALNKAGAQLHTVVSSGGTSAATAQNRFGFARAATDVAAVLGEPAIDAVLIATRHDTHAHLVIEALKAGKAVFVEKPLAITASELEGVAGVLEETAGSLMVGFNRRFAPLTKLARDTLFGRVGPVTVLITVNAGFIPSDHWVHDARTGGGRIIGEGCHFVDLARALVGAPICAVTGQAATDGRGTTIDDVASFTLRFQDGSLASVNYWANGSRSFPKERIDVFADGKTIQIDNWRRIRGFGVGGPLWRLPRRQDKGHEAEVREWVASVRAHHPPPIPVAELLEVSDWTLRIAATIAESRGGSGDRAGRPDR